MTDELTTAQTRAGNARARHAITRTMLAAAHAKIIELFGSTSDLPVGIEADLGRLEYLVGEYGRAAQRLADEAEALERRAS